MNEMDKIHVWIGNTDKSEDEYNKYFEIDYTHKWGLGDPDYKVCPFCKDIGEEWYDEDFIGVYLWSNPLPIREILDDYLLVAKQEKPRVISICESLNLETANAAFYLTDAEVIVPKPYKELYNGLKFIGTFYSEHAENVDWEE